jgi:hypothetical protein
LERQKEKEKAASAMQKTELTNLFEEIKTEDDRAAAERPEAREKKKKSCLANRKR